MLSSDLWWILSSFRPWVAGVFCLVVTVLLLRLVSGNSVSLSSLSPTPPFPTRSIIASLSDPELTCLV